MKLVQCGPVAALLVTMLQSGVVLAKDTTWSFSAGFDGHLFPSAMIVSSMLKPDQDAADDHSLGDPLGTVAVEIEATADNQPIEVAVSSSTIIKRSVFRGKLPKKGESYFISPVLAFDYDRLLATRQASPEDISVEVKLNGKSLGTETKRAVVRSINDCLYSFTNADDEVEDCSYTFAAYVNENHPVVQEILAEALEAEDEDGEIITDSIAGYQGTAEDVKKQLKAVYTAIQDRGVKYSSITTSSVADHDKIGSQHVRLLGDSATQAAANCVDGSVLFCSICRKMGIDSYLVSVPGHMFMGFYLDPEHKKRLEIETTMVGDDTFEDAVKAGVQARKEAGDKFDDEDETDYQIIDIEEARQMGIIPIKDSKADTKEKRGE